jgi:8-amino-7-oxononanoate synthase
MSKAWELLEPTVSPLLDRVAAGREAGQYHYLVGYEAEQVGPYVRVDGERLLMMSSYSYLGLNGHRRIVEAAMNAVEEHGTATHGVRLLAGSIPLHRQLEQEIARLKDAEDAVVFGSGYAANVGAIAAICGRHDVVLVDKIDHASIVDGCQLSGARVSRFRHNDPDDLARRLERAGEVGVRLVVVDGVYSMDGDLAALPELRKVCDEYDALLMVDEAHALGVVGRRGRGVEEHFERSGLVDIKMGTLSKAIPSVGGYIAGPARLVEYLKHAARPFIFSAALPPAQAAAALEALHVLQDEPHRVARVQTLAARLRGALAGAGLDTGLSETAVIPLIVSDDLLAFEYATECRRMGLVALPVVSPAVPRGSARLRVTVTAGHTDEDVDRAAEGFARAAWRSGLVRAA